MRQKIFLILGILLEFETGIFAQSTAVPFLLTEPTAKANGMAGSYTAIANDGNAMFYNPAGLVQMNYGSFEYGYYNYYPRLNYLNDIWIRYYAATAYIPSIGGFGISITYFSLGKSIVTDEAGNIIKTYYPNEWALALGYARYMSTELAMGASFKLIRSYIGPSLQFGAKSVGGTNMALAFDIGLLYENFLPELCFSKRYLEFNLLKWCIHRPPAGPSVGLTIRNIGPAMDYYSESEPLPQQLRLGLAWILIDTDILGLLLSTDLRKMLVHDNDNFLTAIMTSWQRFSFNRLKVSYGLELSLFTIISFRYGKFLDEKQTYTINSNYTTYGISIGPETFRLNWYRKRYDNKHSYQYDDNIWRIGFSAVY